MADLTQNFVDSRLSTLSREIAGLQALKARPVSARSFVDEMTPKDRRQYSLPRVVRDLFGERGVAGFEREVSRELEQQTGQPSTGNSIIVPMGMLFRDLTAASAPAGGYLVETQVGPEIQTLRARGVFGPLGATFVPNLVGNLVLPKFQTGAGVTWHSTEGMTSTEQQPIIGLCALSPKTVSSFVELSRTLLLQSEAERIIANDLVGALSAAIDIYGIDGSGASGQPFGILKANLNTVTGASLGWSGVLDFIKNAGDANTDLSGFATTPTIYKLLSNREKFTGAGPIIVDQMIDARPVVHSTAIPAGTLLGGPFSEIFVGLWSTIELSLNPYAKFSQALVGLRAIFTIDVAVRYLDAFTKSEVIT